VIFLAGYAMLIGACQARNAAVLWRAMAGIVEHCPVYTFYSIGEICEKAVESWHSQCSHCQLQKPFAGASHGAEKWLLTKHI